MKMKAIKALRGDGDHFDRLPKLLIIEILVFHHPLYFDMSSFKKFYCNFQLNCAFFQSGFKVVLL